MATYYSEFDSISLQCVKSPGPELLITSINRLQNVKSHLRDITECLHLPKLVPNQLKAPEIVVKLSRIASESLLLASIQQNFVQNFNKLLSVVLPGHKLTTTRPQIVVKLLSVVSRLSASSPNTTQRPQSSQIVPKSSQIDANHYKMLSAYQNVAFNLNCDIIVCLISHLYVPKSTPIITKWSQIVRNAPQNHLLRCHSMSYSPHTHSQLL